jgi:aldose 1-epimerase
MNKFFLASLGIVAGLMAGCDNGNQPPVATTTTDTVVVKVIPAVLPDTAAFRDTAGGQNTALYILKNGRAKAAVTNYGARLVSLIVPDKNGMATDVVVGYDNIGNYLHQPDTYFGAIVGRYGNRIAKGHFKLIGKEYTLATNDGPNTLHGGRKGFDAGVWTAKQLGDTSVELHYLSTDGEEGFPGNLQVKVTYTLDSNALHIYYEATTDKAGTINDHLLQIVADKYTPVDSTLIPTGKLEPVAGTPFDFRQPTAIGSRIGADNQQLKYGKGYDHNFVLNSNTADGKFRQTQVKLPDVTVQGDKSGIVMNVYTDQPGVQFYGGNFMKGSNPIKGGKKDDYRSAFCLETQHYPDSPNEPSFPSTELKPGQTYKSWTSYSFAVKP